MDYRHQHELVLCDSFDVPILPFVDTPGFIIGRESERQRAPGKIMNFMNALQLVMVPKLTVILRTSYGQAYINMGGGRNSDEVAAWSTAEVSFMDPAFAARVVARGRGEDPEEIERVRERIERLADPGSFRGVGKLTGTSSYDEGGRVRGVRPAPYVMGLARIDSRPVAAGGEDFTIRGGTSWGAFRRKGGQGGFVEDLGAPARRAQPPGSRESRQRSRAKPGSGAGSTAMVIWPSLCAEHDSDSSAGARNGSR